MGGGGGGRKGCGRGKVAEILDFNVLSDVDGENYKLLNCRSHTPSLVKHLTLTYSIVSKTPDSHILHR